MASIINIDDKGYAPYLEINCADTYRSNLISALDSLWKNTEFQQLCIDAQRHHEGQKLRISCDDKQLMTMYGCPKDRNADNATKEDIHNITNHTYDHHITICPRDVGSSSYITQDGGKHPSLLKG